MLPIESFPALNSSLNFLAFIFLLLGRWQIYKGRRELHKIFMTAAFVISSVFLACYLYYHFNSEIVTTYKKTGFLAVLYYSMLISHIVLAAVMTPGIIWALILGYKNKISEHKKIARWVWMVWTYVSFTGVLIYLMLYQF